METSQVVLTLVTVIALVVIGALALFRPHDLQGLATSATQGTRDIPVVRRVWYDWARSRYYVGVTRFLGAFALLLATALIIIMLLGTR